MKRARPRPLGTSFRVNHGGDANVVTAEIVLRHWLNHECTAARVTTEQTSCVVNVNNDFLRELSSLSGRIMLFFSSETSKVVGPGHDTVQLDD